MHIQPTYHRAHPGSKVCQVVKSRNDLQINRIDYIRDSQHNRLVIYLESDLLSGQEINAFMQGMNLVIEAPCLLDFEGPIRRHLIEQKDLSNYEKEIYEIGFSEVQLDQGFSYGIISCRMINPGLLKIVLSFKRLKNKSTKNVN
jgi:hypothetical protein